MTAQTAQLWDAQAATFDGEPDHGLVLPTVRAAWAALMAECVPSPSTVLDVGCGTGSLAVLLAEQGHVVSGVDLSPKMLDKARAKAMRHGVSARFVLGDAAEPPVEPEFDVVLARHLVWALPDPSQALDNWLALMPAGGTFVLVEGLWGTGAGLPAKVLADLVEPRVDRMSLRPLDDPALWGRPITDERYLIHATT